VRWDIQLDTWQHAGNRQQIVPFVCQTELYYKISVGAKRQTQNPEVDKKHIHIELCMCEGIQIEGSEFVQTCISEIPHVYTCKNFTHSQKIKAHLVPTHRPLHTANFFFVSSCVVHEMKTTV